MHYVHGQQLLDGCKHSLVRKGRLAPSASLSTGGAMWRSDLAGPTLVHVHFTQNFTAAAGYKYDLVKMANPSISVADDATPADGTASTFSFVTDEGPLDLPVDANLGASTNTFELSGLADGLYIVRVWSYNDNDPTGVASSWSTVIGTGKRPPQRNANLQLAVHLSIVAAMAVEHGGS